MSSSVKDDKGDIELNELSVEGVSFGNMLSHFIDRWLSFLNYIESKDGDTKAQESGISQFETSLKLIPDGTKLMVQLFNTSIKKSNAIKDSRVIAVINILNMRAALMDPKIPLSSEILLLPEKNTMQLPINYEKTTMEMLKKRYQTLNNLLIEQTTKSTHSLQTLIKHYQNTK